MRIECPSCSAAYDVPDRLLAGGKKLRCARCAHQWAPQEAADLAPPTPPEPPPPPPPSTLAPPPTAMRDLDAERPPEPELHVEPKRPPHKRPESPSRLPVILALVASAVVLAALLGGLVFARAEVMRLWDPSKRLFGWLGLA